MSNTRTRVAPWSITILLVTGAAHAQAPSHGAALNPAAGYVDATLHTLDDGTVLFVDYYGNMSRSPDGGRTWPVVDQPISTYPIDDLDADGSIVAVTGIEVIGGGATNTRRPTVGLSLDWGSTWSSTALASWPANNLGGETRVHVTGGQITVLWTEPFSGAVRARHSPDAGQTWGPPTLLGQTPVYLFSPGISHVNVVAEDQTLHMFWLSYGPQGNEGWLQSSTDGGQTWLPAPRQTSAPTFNPLPWMKGSVDVLFLRAIGSPLERSTDGGVTWTPVQGLAFSKIHDVAVQDQFVLVAGEDNTTVSSTTWYLQASTDGGQTWATPGLQASSFPGFGVALDVAGDDAFATFANPLQPQYGVVARSDDQGQTWSTFDTTLVQFDADARRTFHVLVDGAGYFGYVGCGWTPLGSGTAGTGGAAPSLELARLPVLGRATSLDVANARGGAIGAIGLGWAQPQATPLAGGTLWLQGPLVTSAFVTSGAAGAPAAGDASTPFSLPNVPQLVGARLTAQAVVVDPQGIGGLVLTPGIEVWLR